MKFLAKTAIHHLSKLEAELDKSILSVQAAINKEKAENNNPIVLAMLKGKKKAYCEIATNLGFKIGKVNDVIIKGGEKYENLGGL